MTKRIVAGVITAGLWLITFYAAYAFVVWDLYWLHDIGTWSVSSRAMLLYMMGIVPMVGAAVSIWAAK